MKALILAAGMGMRMSPQVSCKPLVLIQNTSLIQRVMSSLLRAGICEQIVVTGYKGETIQKFLKQKIEGISLNVLHNDLWEEGNGSSVLRAKETLCKEEKFLLMMGDHIIESSAISEFSTQDLVLGCVRLCVDFRIENSKVDIQDVTRVLEKDGKIQKIGKGMEKYNCFDTGMFLCQGKAIFDALEESWQERKDGSLSGGIRILAKKEKVLTWDIKDKFWIDVDDKKAMIQAEYWLKKKKGSF